MMKKSETNPIGYWVIASVIGVASVAMIAVSMWMNYAFNYSFAGNDEHGRVMGAVSIIADVCKATMLVAAIMLWRARWKVIALIAVIFWASSLVFGTFSAVGFAGQERSVVVGGREAVTAVYNEAKSELERTQVKLASLNRHRSVGELEAAINAKLAHPVVAAGSSKVLGTVTAVSKDCAQPDKRTADDCGEIAALRAEMGVAVEAARLEKHAADLQAQVDDARNRGAMVAANPQAEVISWLTIGWVKVENVAFAWPVFFALIVEGLSGFGPTIVFALIDVARGKRREPVTSVVAAAAPPVAPPTVVLEVLVTGKVANYLVDCTDPADETVALGAGELFDDYHGWCTREGLASASQDSFIADFDRLREGHLSEVRKSGGRYYGLRLRSRVPVISIARGQRQKQIGRR